MIDRILYAVFHAGVAHPWRVLGVAFAVGLTGLGALRVPLDLSFAGIMNRDHPEVARYFEASERLGLGGLLPALLEGPEDRLDAAVADLTLALDDLDVVRAVEGPPPRDWLLANAPWLVDAETFDRWLVLADAAGPSDRAAFEALERSLRDLERGLGPARVSGRRLVVVTLVRDAFELALDSDAFPRVRAAAEAALAPYDVTARFSGMAAIMTQEQEATLARMRWLAPISLLLVLALFYVIEPRPLMLLSVAVPMLLSIGCTLALIGWIEGGLSIMESVFGVIVFGLGVDFGIHLLLRLREEQGRGHDLRTALDLTIRGTGRGISAGAVTTAGAFGILALAPDPVFQRLGLAGAVGLTLCLVFLLVMLPAAWTLVDRRQPGRGRPGPRRFGHLFEHLAARAVYAPRTSLALAGIVLAASAAGLSSLRYETRLDRVFSRDIEAVADARRIHETYGIDPGPWAVEVEDLAEARRVSEAFARDPLFARSESLASLLRPDREARAARLEERAPSIARRVRAREAAVADLALAREAAGRSDGAGIAAPSVDGHPHPGAIDSEVGALDRARREILLVEALLRAQALGPPTRETLPAALSDRLVGPDGGLVVYAFVAEPVLDSEVAARERRAAQAVHPDATSMNVVYEALIGTDRPWMPPLVALVVLFMAGVLWLDYRSVKLVALALVPVSAAGLVTVGGLSALGFSFNTVTWVAVPLLLGLGVDDGIHIVHRMIEEPSRRLPEVVGSVGRSIALTTLTTCASVSTLVFTRHPGIESVAILLLVGLPLCLLASVTLLPACAVLWRAREAGRARVESVSS